MSILHYDLSNEVSNGPCVSSHLNDFEKRTNRDVVKDLKEGIDLVFELKAHIDKLHPIATETILRMLSF